MASNMQMPLLKSSNGSYIRDLRRRLRLALGSLDALTGKMEEIEKDLAILECTLVIDSGRIRESEESPVAYNLDIRSRHYGYIEVSLDGGKWLSLNRRLAEVFLLIATGTKECSGSDDLVGWRSRDEIHAFIQASAKRPLRSSYVNNLINLLKNKLFKAGYARDLIQVDRQKRGIRLALKSGARGLQGVSSLKWLQVNQDSQ
jgi:hypothetical protein